jgi:hypothetical protein
MTLISESFDIVSVDSRNDLHTITAVRFPIIPALTQDFSSMYRRRVKARFFP